MIIILVFASLSFGFPFGFRKPRPAVLGNTSVGASSQIFNKDHTQSQFAQLTNSENKFVEQKSSQSQPKKFSNEPCHWDVSQTPGTNTKNNVTLALLETCSDVYDIFLLDTEHAEKLEVDQDSTIFIQGTTFGDQQTVWKFDDSATNGDIISLSQGSLTLQNIDFQYFVNSVDSTRISPDSRLIYVAGQPDMFPSLTVVHCNFKGLVIEQESQDINEYAVLISGANEVIFDQCSFSDVKSSQGIVGILVDNKVMFDQCSFSGLNANMVPLLIFAINSLKLKDCNFTDINAGSDSGAFQVSYMNDNDYEIEITGNQFTNCESQGSGAFSISNLQEPSTKTLKVNGNTIANCINRNGYPSVNIDYYDFDSIELKNNKFVDNIALEQSDNYGCDVSIKKNTILDPDIDPVQYYRSLLEGSTTQYPESIFYSIYQEPTDNSGYLNIDSLDGKCWDSEFEYGGNKQGCTCTAQGHPDDCTCPLNDDDEYTKTQCEYNKLSPCDSDTTPSEGCKCTTDKHPTNCACPLNNDGQYTQTQCIIDKLPVCSGDTTPSEGCKCTNEKHPDNCACPFDDLETYAKTQCQFDKLPVCNGDSEPIGGCRCSSSNYPSYCKCPLNNLDIKYSKAQCEAEKQYSLLPPCESDTTTTTGGCKCTHDKHPSEPVQCACPLNNDDQYTKTQCSFDKLPVCNQDQEPTGGCRCSTDNYPSYCKCPLNNDDEYSKDQCEYDVLSSCNSDTTPSEGCKCIHDKHPTNCVCPLNNDGQYTQTQCIIDKLPVCSGDITPSEGCKCTNEKHPDNCACPFDDLETYTKTQCQFDTLPVCSGDSEPIEGCRCSSSNYPSYCKCPLNNLDIKYSKAQCEAEKQYSLLPLCESDTTTTTGGCKCTHDKHPSEPIQCACPFDDLNPTYTKSQCQFDKLPVCSGNSEPTGGCKCSTDNYPSYCKCPLNNDDEYSKDQCEYDMLSSCNSDTTPSEGCKCTTDKHPDQCVCPLNNDGQYTQTQCQFDKLPVCSGDSEPTGGCKCSTANYPSYCKCPLNDDDSEYTQMKCEQEKEIANPLIQCTGTGDEPNCICPSDDLDPTYTKTQCEYDKLSPCNSDTTPSEGCQCTNNNHPTNCACPLNNDNSYTKQQCEIDIQPQKSEEIDITPEEKLDPPSDPQQKSNFAWWGTFIIVLVTLVIVGSSIIIIYCFIKYQMKPKKIAEKNEQQQNSSSSSSSSSSKQASNEMLSTPNKQTSSIQIETPSATPSIMVPQNSILSPFEQFSTPPDENGINLNTQVNQSVEIKPPRRLIRVNSKSVKKLPQHQFPLDPELKT
ncbi:MAG: hypothetical protein EZS28_005983 [Streblomastix strix]|uniref:Right handed beta helix domain-containing protein n=1 Tax=Streblomastix strix TaxID=222440 RepID=A0A5J4WUL7_9EUKA|nr:MAG: hypothetical protein EZS28_005983 [Streblomastix strix]